MLPVCFCRYSFDMSKQRKPVTGRPKKQPGEARTAILQVRLTVAERELLDKAARAKALDTSAWVRMEALALAKRVTSSGGN